MAIIGKFFYLNVNRNILSNMSLNILECWSKGISILKYISELLHNMVFHIDKNLSS